MYGIGMLNGGRIIIALSIYLPLYATGLTGNINSN